MTLTGILTDFEGDVARINDQPKKMLPAAAKWCTDRLKKGMTIDYEVVEDGEKKGWIAKLWERKAAPSDSEEKRKAAGFGQPPGGNTENCTSSDTPPATGIKTVEGQIIEIDKPAHKITVKDKFGARHSFIWGPALDAEFSKLNQWWFCKVTGEHEPDVDLWRATDQAFFKRPDDWPAPAHGRGGYGGQPRNEKMIVVQSMLKTYAELWPNCHTPDTVSFKDAREEILAAVEADLPRVLKAGGVQ